ncbi:MAG: shikimate dehydrogenase [Akkermansia sp.]|nr:shikimate dehydrogenase [Akkermansia sp.]
MQAVYTAAEYATTLTADLAPHRVRLGVVGNPIAHSCSPQMQQAALHAAAMPGTYVRLQAGLEAGAFEQALATFHRMGFTGLNITVPFKRRAFAAADCSADALATRCGACNTLVRTETGWTGYNTDGPGFARAIAELCGKPLGQLRVALLGACGGAGTALAYQCALDSCPQLAIINRPKPALDALAQELAAISPGRVHAAAMGTDAHRSAVQQADLVVNATSLGLSAGDPMPLDPAWLQPGQVVYDIVTHATPLQQAARERGCTASHGLGMLLWQGAYAFEKWFHTLPDTAAMQHALLLR